MKIPTKSPVTTAAVIKALEDAILKEELTLSEKVSAAVQAWDGKRYTDKKFLATLPSGPGLTWYIARPYGRPEIVGRLAGSYENAYRFSFAYGEGNRIDAATFEKENPSHFAGARERNALRAELLSTPNETANAAAILEGLRLSRIALEEAENLTKEYFRTRWNARSELMALAETDDGKRW